MSRSKAQRPVVIRVNCSRFEITLATGRVRPRGGQANGEPLKIDREQLDPLPLSGLGIEKDIVLRSAVNGGGPRIQHLERIPTAGRAGKHPFGIFFAQRGRRGRRARLVRWLRGKRLLMR